MVLSENLRKFLDTTLEYLKDNPKGYQDKLASGDISSIKLLLDLALKIYELDRKIEPLQQSKSNKDKNLTSGELNYEKLFDHYKDNIKE